MSLSKSSAANFRSKIFGASVFFGVSGFFVTQRKSSIDLIRGGLVGAAAVMNSYFILHIVDNVNVRTKTTPGMTSLQMAKIMYKTEGIYSFFRGISIILYTYHLGGFVQMAFYVKLKSLFRSLFKDQQSKWIYFLSSLVSTYVSLVILYPFDKLKARFQSNSPQFQYKSFLEGVHDLLPKESKYNLFKAYSGGVPYLASWTVNVSLRFTFYEALRLYVTKKIPKSKRSLLEISFIGCSFISGALAAFLSNFLDVLAIHKQLDPSLKIMKIIKSKGRKIFLNGILPRSIHNGIIAILGFTFLNFYGKLFTCNIFDSSLSKIVLKKMNFFTFFLYF